MRFLWNPSKHRPITASYCDLSCKAAWQRRQKPVDREWLVEHYERQGMNAAQIARIVNRDGKQVWRWLTDYGISTRPRGSDVIRQWKDGERTPRAGTPHTDAAKDKIRQARIREGRVPYLKDGVHYMKGRTGAAHHGWKGGLTPEREALYSTGEWKEAVKAVWRRANAKCERCGKDHRKVDNRTASGFHIHHIIPFEHVAHRSEISNLILLCRPCHHFVHSRKNTGKEYISWPS